MKKGKHQKVVLAYSGGLDTSIIIPWLKENYDNCEVIAVSGDVGQGTELDGLEEKAIKTGASKLYVLDLKKDFVENYIFPHPEVRRQVRGLPAGHRLRPPLHRKGSGRYRHQGRRGRHLPRLHRQGQRPGPFRADPESAGPRYGHHRPVA